MDTNIDSINAEIRVLRAEFESYKNYTNKALELQASEYIRRFDVIKQGQSTTITLIFSVIMALLGMAGLVFAIFRH